MVLTIDIHEVEHLALSNSFLSCSDVHHLIIYIKDVFLANSILAIGSTHNGVYTPIIKNCGTTILTAKALFIHTSLAILLTKINHEWILLKQGRHN